jgi:Pectate lyase superfamily protein
MFWKVARIAVVLSACALISSAVASDPFRGGPRSGALGVVPGLGATQPSATAPGSATQSPRPTGTSGPPPHPTASGASTSTPAPGGSAPPPARAAPLPQPITSVASYGAVGNGHTDSTNAIANAVSVASARGGTLYFPPGHYLVRGVGIGSGIEIHSGRALTIAGAGRDLVTITNTNASGGLLSIQVDHTVVEGLTLDAQTANTRQALGVVANDVIVESCRILGGSQFFAIYYAGPQPATTSVPVYNTGNQLINDVVSDQVNNDGISWSFQENSLIENLQHTGSRLALYVDRYVTVQNEIYHPGSQAGGTAGFWISSPSDHITINNFTSYGMGGIISNNGTSISTNITIANERLMVPGYTLRVDAVNGLTIRGCNFGSGSTLLFAGATTTTGVVVESCAALPMVRFQGNAIVRATFLADRYPVVASPGVNHLQTFFNFNNAAPLFSVNGGVWGNRAGGFFGGAPAVYTVTNLIGYP